MKAFPFVLLVMLLVLVSCRKEQPGLDDTNNCDCAKEVSAGFKMGQLYDGELIDLDTIHYYLDYETDGSSSLNGNCYVNFSADLENATSYEWQIGNNLGTQNTREFGIYFNDTTGTIPIMLVVHSKPNTICFPDDDGIDTVVRYLTVHSRPVPYLTGTYVGHNTDAPGQSFTITIDTFRYTTPDFDTYILYGIKNLPNGNGFDGINWMNTVSFSGATESGDGLVQLTGPFNGFFDKKTRRITITYSARYYNADFSAILNELTNKTFVGVKQ
jgi:hypothetical protein